MKSKIDLMRMGDTQLRRADLLSIFKMCGFVLNADVLLISDQDNGFDDQDEGSGSNEARESGGDDEVVFDVVGKRSHATNNHVKESKKSKTVVSGSSFTFRGLRFIAPQFMREELAQSTLD
jgi:hypothetical protein